jgi:single-strand DNA-binding protein
MNSDTPMTITGNLTADPELRFTASGLPVADFTVASTPRRYDKATGEWVDGDTLFLRCAAWRDLGEHCAESLAKGTRVVAAGRLRQTHWETPEGDKRTAFQLDVDEVGPSLRWATARVSKTSRERPPLADPWGASTPHDEMTEVTKTEPAAATVPADEPPF